MTIVYTGRYGWRDDIAQPEGGAYLHVHWAVRDCSYIEWYPHIEAARVALRSLAATYNCTSHNDYVDLTPGEGYVESEAWVSASPEFGLAQ